MVQALIEILSSDDVALDGRHSPALYSKFLRSLLEKYLTPSLQAQIAAIAVFQPQNQTQRHYEQVSVDSYTWPDTTLPNIFTPQTQTFGNQYANASTSTSCEGHVARQLVGEPDMDFSLTHFVESTRNPSYGDTESSPLSQPMPAPAYTLEELEQLVSTPPGYSDSNWMRPFFGNM